MWRVFDQPIGTFVYFFVRYENFVLYHNKKSFFAQILDATLTPLSCSPSFPRAQYLDIRTLMHELVVNYKIILLNVICSSVIRTP